MNTHHGAGAVAPIESHRLYFDGVGSEYFRVWLKSLVLGIVTLGLYAPWAVRRNARYFYGRLEVAGSPLDFTLPLWRLVLGIALVLGLCGACELAAPNALARMLPMAGPSMLLLLPWAWGSATRMRLGHIRWRGLSLNLRAGWGEVYTAAWPLFALALLWAFVGPTFAALAPGLQLRETGAGRFAGPAALLLLSGLLTSLWLARLCFNWKRLMVRRAQVGSEVGHWRLDFSPFLRIAMASLGIFALSLAAAAAACALAARFGLLPEWHGGSAQDAPLVIAAPLLGVLVFVPALAYHDARTFRLVWNHIGVGRLARCRCSLRTRDYVLLRLRNGALTALTLGLYLPFSQLQRWHMKAASLTLHVRGDADELADTLARQHAAFFGSAATEAHRLEFLSATMPVSTR